MIKQIIDGCLENRFLVIIATLLILAGGLWAVRTIPLDAVPWRDAPLVLAVLLSSFFLPIPNSAMALPLSLPRGQRLRSTRSECSPPDPCARPATRDTTPPACTSPGNIPPQW